MQQLPLSTQMVLLGAAQLLRARGWCQGQSEDSRGRMCTLGAITRYVREHADTATMDGIERAASAEAAATIAISELVERLHGAHVADYNDVPGRDAREMIALLERAAGAV